MSRRSATTTKVFVGSLPANATTEDLKRLFEPYGAIAECDIANRCGFLHLEDKDLATKAIEELNNTTFMGVRISVEKGRVKPPNRSRGGRGGGSGGGGGPMRGGKDRGGPYSRDGFGPRSRGGGFGGRDYPPYGERYDYDRGGRFEGYGDRRPGGYEDRRGSSYMGDRGRPYPNGYDRRPPYEDRPPYSEAPRGGYDERRMAPAGSFDDRRPPMNERRPLMEQQIGQGARTQPSNFDRSGTSSDMFSRRDNAAKPMDRAAGYNSPSGGGSYGANTTSSYGQSGGQAGAYGGYGDSRSTGGYDSRTPMQTGGYGDSRGQGYQDSRGPPALSGNAGGGMYSDTRGGAGGGAGAYGGSGTGGGYGGSAAGGYDGYGSSRSGAYDSAYPPLPQQRGYSSGGGPTPSRDMLPGPGRRF